MSDDPIYDRFAARLADAVTVAINSGIKVSSADKSCFCPLGCLGNPNPKIPRRPTGGYARNLDQCVGMLPHMAPSDFGAIFDGAVDTGFQGNEKYHELALKYRERFP